MQVNIKRHGGIPTEEPIGFAIFPGIAALALVISSICLGVALRCCGPARCRGGWASWSSSRPWSVRSACPAPCS
jgi:hypothetical protein